MVGRLGEKPDGEVEFFDLMTRTSRLGYDEGMPLIGNMAINGDLGSGNSSSSSLRKRKRSSPKDRAFVDHMEKIGSAVEKYASAACARLELMRERYEEDKCKADAASSAELQAAEVRRRQDEVRLEILRQRLEREKEVTSLALRERCTHCYRAEDGESAGVTRRDPREPNKNNSQDIVDGKREEELTSLLSLAEARLQGARNKKDSNPEYHALCLKLYTRAQKRLDDVLSSDLNGT